VGEVSVLVVIDVVAHSASEVIRCVTEGPGA
jgi:hypothetical protein